MAKRRGLGKGLDAIFMENESENKNSTVTLKIADIEPNANQPRTEYDETAVAELAESIKQHGLLQPLVVRPLIGGGYQIVAGERRYRACRMAGLTEVAVIIRELTDSETMELALIENLQRENLNPVDEANGYRALLEEYGFSQEEVARSVGKSRPAVANALRLLKLPEEISRMVSGGKLSAGHARALLALDDKTQLLPLAEDIIANDFSVRQTEKLIKIKNAEQKQAQKKPRQSKTKPAYFSEVELALTEYLGKRVKVEPLKGKQGGVLQIEFYSDDDLRDLAKRFE